MNWWLSPSNYCIQTMIPIYFFRQYIPFIHDYNPIIVLVGGFNPSEKWWSSSVGMMKFPTEWNNNPFMFQTNNQL